MDLKLLESVMRAFCPQTSKGHFNVPEGYNFRGAVFDLDGVVTQTSHLHEEAWKQLFDEFLNKKKNESQARGDDPADTKKKTKKKKEDEGHEDAEEGVGGKLCEGGKEKAESSSDNGRHVQFAEQQDSEAKAESSADKEGKPKRDGEDKEEEETVPNGDPYRPFTEQDYLTYVDGRPRIDGMREFCVCVLCVCVCFVCSDDDVRCVDRYHHLFEDARHRAAARRRQG